MKQSNKKDIGTLLKREPVPSTVCKNPKGFLYIPIKVIEEKLDTIFGWKKWKTENWVYIESYKKASGSLSLCVKVGNEWICRTGGVTLPMTTDKSSDDYIENLVGVLISLSLVNAVKRFGKTFGRDLNRELEDVPITEKEASGATGGTKNPVSEQVVKSAVTAIETASDRTSKIKKKITKEPTEGIQGILSGEPPANETPLVEAPVEAEVAVLPDPNQKNVETES